MACLKLRRFYKIVTVFEFIFTDHIYVQVVQLQVENIARLSIYRVQDAA
jgi:hypothetical protein